MGSGKGQAKRVSNIMGALQPPNFDDGSADAFENEISFGNVDVTTCLELNKIGNQIDEDDITDEHYTDLDWTIDIPTNNKTNPNYKRHISGIRESDGGRIFSSIVLDDDPWTPKGFVNFNIKDLKKAFQMLKKSGVVGTAPAIDNGGNAAEILLMKNNSTKEVTINVVFDDNSGVEAAVFSDPDGSEVKNIIKAAVMIEELNIKHEMQYGPTTVIDDRMILKPQAESEGPKPIKPAKPLKEDINF